MLIRKSERDKNSLSNREWSVLIAITRGQRMKEIAAELGISIKTASTYRARILAKTGCKNTAELIIQAFKQGLVQVNE